MEKILCVGVSVIMKRAVISITNACVLHCLHCYNKNNNCNCTADYIDEEFVNQLYSIGIRQIVLSGGEPTIEWDLLLSVLKLFKNRFSIVITSNGVLLNIMKIHVLKESGVSRLQISLDGASACSHEYLRGKGTYSHTLQLIKTFPEFITPMFTIHAKNYCEVGDFIEQQLDNGVKKIGFERFIPIKGNINNRDLELSKDQLFMAYDIISKYKGIDFHINDPLFNTYLFIKNKIPINIVKSFTDIGCQAQKHNIYIDAIGDVHPCVFSNDVLFNVHEEPLSTCTRLSSPSIKGCIGCDYYCVCKGCRAAAKTQFDDWLEIDPLCPLH